jgi:chromosome segregation ATPase
MPDTRADSLLALAADLERRDAELASRVDRVDALAAAAASLRERAVSISGFMDGLPALLAGVEQQEAASRAALDEARAELERARAAVAELEGRRRKQEQLDQARRELARAEQGLADGESRVERAAAAREALAVEERARRDEARRLSEEAPLVAKEIERVPRISASGRSSPGHSLEEIVAWGDRARAALFVVRGSLVAERERIVAEAVALGESALGEEVRGASVAQLRRRLERALR